MRKLLVFFFLVLIISFSVVGIIQKPGTQGVKVEQQSEEILIQESKI